MKKVIPIIILSILASFNCHGQTKKVPKNLKQAVKELNKDASDSLKHLIIKTEDEELKKLSYPWGSNYQTIYYWINEENENSKLAKYLNSKGIELHQLEVILIAFKQFLLSGIFDENTILKPFQELEIKWAEEDKIRFITDTLRGYYIPKDLEDCFRQIDSFWNDSTKNKIKSLSENEFAYGYHHGFGTKIRNRWQLWGGSRLSAYFNEKGISHPDDIWGIIMKSYHRYLNNKVINLEEQIQYYKNYWEKIERQNKVEKDKEFSKYNIGDTVSFEYNLGFVSAKQEQKFDDDICIAKGLVIGRNEEYYFIRVKLLESCDKRGIIAYDSKNTVLEFNKKTGKWEKPKKRTIQRLKNNQKGWFRYKDWEPENDQ